MSADDPQAKPRVRTGQTPTELSKDEFIHRWNQNFYDSAFEKKRAELDAIGEIAWEAYHDSRKAPRTRKAGPGFADPEHELSIEWLDAREKIIAAQKQHDSKESKTRVLLICASPRTDQTCPSEMSKTFRLTKTAEEIFAADHEIDVDFLDLSVLTAEYGRKIYPCKACVSTAMPLCHWPCSCYPNHYLGQTHDWMYEIYPRWVAAHGIMIVAPVHWYQVPSVFKLMMDRLVCADGGNPDPTSTHGKTPEEAKALGILLEITEPDALLTRARELATSIAAKPPLAVRYCKRLLKLAQQQSLAEHLDVCSSFQAICHKTDDHHEALTAFREKRRGNYKGR